MSSTVESPSGKPTLKLPSLTYGGQRSLYRSRDYKDEFGNRWSIELTGEAKVIRAFRDEGKLELLCAPISDEEWKKAREEVHILAQEDRKGLPKSDPDHKSNLPTLEIRAVLSARKVDTPHYRLRYNVFVPDAGSSEHRHTLYAGADGVARVDWQVATGTSISVQLSWKWGSGAVGTLALEDAGQHSVWDVVVEKVAGTSYWLFGDVIVPAS